MAAPDPLRRQAALSDPLARVRAAEKVNEMRLSPTVEKRLLASGLLVAVLCVLLFLYVDRPAALAAHGLEIRAGCVELPESAHYAALVDWERVKRFAVQRAAVRGACETAGRAARSGGAARASPPSGSCSGWPGRSRSHACSRACSTA